MMFVELQGLGRAHCDGGGGLPGPGSVCYRPNQQHHDDSRSVRSDDGDARPGSGSRSDLNDSHCGLGDDSDAGYFLQSFLLQNMHINDPLIRRHMGSLFVLIDVSRLKDTSILNFQFVLLPFAEKQFFFLCHLGFSVFFLFSLFVWKKSFLYGINFLGVLPTYSVAEGRDGW